MFRPNAGPTFLMFIYRPVLSFVFLALLGMASFFASCAQAQDVAPLSRIFPLTLTNETVEIFPTEKSLFVLEDIERKLGFNSVIAMIQNGEIAEAAYKHSVVSLGSNGNPFWIIIPVLNSSDQDIWSLHLGSSGYGRMGFANKAILYESTSRKTFFNTTLKSDLLDKDIYLSSELALNLPKNQPAYLILYVEGRTGVLTTFKPSIHAATSMQNDITVLKPQVKTFLIISIFILLTGFIFKKDPSFLTLAAMWGILFGYETFLDHFFLIDNFLGQVITPCFRLVFPVLLFVSLWLTSGAKDKYPSSLFIGTGLLFVICSLLGLALISTVPTISTSLSFVPMIGISLLTMLLTWPFASMYGGTSLCGIAIASRAFLVIGIWSAVETIHPLSSVNIMVHAIPWLASAVAILSSIYQIRFSDQSPLIEAYEKKEKIDSLTDSFREAREASEHTRLLHVLDQERLLMKELQLQEVRRTEEMKRAKESADEANVAKSAFLAVVSHEIRTPMTGIMGMVRLMLDTGLSREQKEYANTIQDSGEALLSLLNDILDFEKIESGKLELEKTNFDLKRLIKGIHILMNGHAASKNIDLILDMDEKIPDFVMGDPTRLRQVLLNLVNNAIKFTSRGNVTIQIKDLSSAGNTNSPIRQIYFGIQDSGIGISAEAQKKIFMPFSQADASINRKFGGTGLGLTICKKLIEAMGSSIGINSRENEGSTFFFTLPMEVSTAENSIKKPMTGLSENTGRKLRVLVVDDNGINQKVLHGLLGRMGHFTVLASNADEAVSAVQETSFDLVLMDIELPGKSGLDATQEIRALADPALANIPIVAMTGNTSQEDIKKYLAGGMNEFIGKPVMPETLKQLVFRAGRGDFTVQRKVSAPLIISQNVTEDQENTEEDDFASAVRQFEEAGDEKTPDQELIEDDVILATGESLLDEVLVASLIKSLGSEQTLALMKDFYDKCEELIADLEAAFGEKDHEAVKARSHELRGMAANFGFKSLAAGCSDIEQALAENKEADLRPLLEHLFGFYQGSRSEMERRLKQKISS